MGSNLSKTYSNFNTDVINTTINNIINTNYVSQSSEIQGVSSMKITIEDSKIRADCNFKILNTIENSLKSFAYGISNNLVSISNEDITSIQNDIQKQITQANEKLNLFQSNVVEDTTIISNNIINSITNNIKNKLTTLQKSLEIAQADTDVTIKGIDCDGNFTIENYISQMMDTKLISEQTVNDIISNQNNTDILNKYKIEISQKNVGIDPTIIFAIIAAIFLIITILPISLGFGSLMKYLFPILFLSSIIGCIIGIYYKTWIILGICLITTFIIGGVWSFS